MSVRYIKKTSSPLPNTTVSSRGFTLIEVIVSITLLFIVVAAVFYFYSNMMDNEGKIREKYTLLRITKEFIDSFAFRSADEAAKPGGGANEREGFILQWRIYPAEERRDVFFSSGVVPQAQLNRVHLRIVKKETKKQVLELQFLVNTILPAK